MQSNPIIPAAPGWFVCEPRYDEHDSVIGFEEHAVVAWALEADTGDEGEVLAMWAWPVCPELTTLTTTAAARVLRRSDGRYSHDGLVLDRDEMVQEMARADQARATARETFTEET